MRPLVSFSAHTRGNVAVITALALTAIGAAVAGGIDMSRMSDSGSTLQDVADAAALNIATDVGKAPASTGDAELQARANDIATLLAAPAFRDTKSPYSGDVKVEIQSRTPAKVKVTLSQRQDMLFAGMLGFKSLPLGRASTAVSRAAYPVCMLVLDPDASRAWSTQGTSDVVGPQCVAQVNSSSSGALDSNGNASVRMLRTFVVAPQQSAHAFSPTPSFDEPPLEDPLAARFAWPDGGPCQTLGQFKKETVSLSPGTYCGGLDLATGAVVRLRPGVYVLKTGDVKLQSGAVLDGTTGVTLVLLDPNGTVSMQAGASLQLSASKTGEWTDVALAVKPQPGERVSSLGGGGELQLDGIVYLPTQYLQLTGGGEILRADAPRTFVVNRLATQGNGLIYLRGSSALMMGAETRLVK
jgi:Flp pilus assembly protein TadG